MIQTHGRNMTSAHYARLGPQERDKIHLASLEILERVGVEVHDERARDLLLKGGASGDERIRLPERLVQKALSMTPRRLTLYDRNGRVAIRAHDYNTYYGGGSDCLNVLDHRTGERRRSTLRDVKEATIVQDALSEFSFVMSMFLPEEVDGRIYDRYQMETMLNHTTKPIVFVSPDFEGCVAAVEMCEVVAGGAEAFRQRPFATCYINVTSGLVANAEALQKCIYLAEKGLPLLYIPLNAGGVNSPATTAGCMATMNAGILLGIVLAQLVREGTPIAVPGWNGGPYNLKTMVANYVLAEEQGVATEMGKYYGLPVFGMGGCTDSKVLDHQCGMEATLSLVTALLHGANIVHDVGFMDAGLQGSLQLQVMANDTIGFLRAATPWTRRRWPWMSPKSWDQRETIWAIPTPCATSESPSTPSWPTRPPMPNGWSAARPRWRSGPHNRWKRSWLATSPNLFCPRRSVSASAPSWSESRRERGSAGEW
jgi:trimethylamine--corrinoid protein Co-methyltransferase